MPRFKSLSRVAAVVAVLSVVAAAAAWAYRQSALTKYVMTAVGTQALPPDFVADDPTLSSDVLGCSVTVVVHGQSARVARWAARSEAARRGQRRVLSENVESFSIVSDEVTGTLVVTRDAGVVELVALTEGHCPIFP